MIANLSEREKRLALITGIVALVGLSYIVYGLLQNAEVEEVSAATAERFDDLFETLNTIDQQKAENANLRDRFGNQQGEFLRENEQAKLFAEIERISGQSGIQLKNISTRTDNRTKPMPTLEIEMAFECQFQQLLNFFRQVRTAQVLLQPQGLRVSLINPNQPNLTVQLNLITYILDVEPASQNGPSTLVQGG